jgi:SAM-dependent methyltransferase
MTSGALQLAEPLGDHPRDLLQLEYLPGVTLDEYVRLVQARHPTVASRLCFTRARAAEMLEALVESENEFEADGAGRGDSYRFAQRDPTTRARGIQELLGLALQGARNGATVLDVLGGDATVARVRTQLPPRHGGACEIVTGDIAGSMVAAALARGLPAVRQAAQFLFVREGSFDTVLLAYGTHHIPRAERHLAFEEARRALAVGGRLVVHDFDEGSPMAQWFSDVVDPYSAAGHEYDHFSRRELTEYFHAAGFEDVEVRELYDPFVVRASDMAQARARLADHLGAMYGLTGIYASLRLDEARERVWELATSIFAYRDAEILGGRVLPRPTVEHVDGCVVAELPRVALVGTGTRR